MTVENFDIRVGKILISNRFMNANVVHLIVISIAMLIARARLFLVLHMYL